MTTTDTFSGMNEGKTSSKVICPPGGASSNIFGDPYDASKDYSLVEKKRQERMAAQDQKLAEERKMSQGAQDDAEQSTQAPVQHAKAPQTDTQGNLFGGSTPAAGSKQKGDEFPAYDVSVYAAQMTPQRRNITQVSTHNPITGEAYAGHEDNDNSTTPHHKGKRQKNLGILTSTEAVYNPITGELISGSSNGTGDGQTAVKNSSKVINPPGGKSSGLW